MYDNTSISALADSVGFGKSAEGNINLDAQNQTGSSGVIFSSFHKLITVDNLLATFPDNVSKYSAKVNEELTQMRNDAAKRTLADVLDSHIDFDDEVDYSQIITDKITLLRKPFSLAVAISSLELMMSSGRYNIGERSIRESYATLKLELEGAKSDQGKTLSYGVVNKYHFAIKTCQKVIFQVRPTVESENQW